MVQQALLDILQPIFDPDFHPSSYGYRPGRSSQMDVAEATLFIRQYHLKWVDDMDLSKCFDRLDHCLIIASISKRMKDGSILTLVDRMANCKELFQELAAWIRCRLRHKQLSHWKTPLRLHRRLRQLEYKGDFPKTRMRSWRNSHSPQVNFAMPNAWFTDLGMYDITSVETGVLPQLTWALPIHEP